MKTEVRLCRSLLKTLWGGPPFPSEKKSKLLIFPLCLSRPRPTLFSCPAALLCLEHDNCIVTSGPWHWPFPLLNTFLQNIYVTNSLSHSDFFSTLFLNEYFFPCFLIPLSLLLCFILFHSAYHLQMLLQCAELVVCLPTTM